LKSNRKRKNIRKKEEAERGKGNRKMGSAKLAAVVQGG